MERAANPCDSGADSAPDESAVLVQTKLPRQIESQSHERTVKMVEKNTACLPEAHHLAGT